MTSRKGPTKSATLFKNGTIKHGNDGNNWKIVTNKVGVKRWQKINGKSKTMGAKTMKNKPKKSIRVLKMEEDPNTVWGKNKPLQKFWEELASGKKVVLIYKTSGYKIFNMPNGEMTRRKLYNDFDDDDNIVAVLSSNMSQDAYQVYLYPKAKDKSVEYVIKNYNKYFKSAGPMPKDLVEKGIPMQRKVLLPA